MANKRKPMIKRNIWQEVLSFFRKRTGQIIHDEDYYFYPDFLNIREKTLEEYQRILIKAGYIKKLYINESFIVKAPPKNISLRIARVMRTN